MLCSSTPGPQVEVEILLREESCADDRGVGNNF